MDESKHNAAQQPTERSEATSLPPVANLFPVVGIGASAGGLRALQRFLARTPADSGLAFVIVTHLSPEHESHLPALLQSGTTLPVIQIAEETTLAPNHVYVIPPGRNLQTLDSHLRLAPMEPERRHRAPIDHFLRTLAGSHDSLAIGVILTGTGSDGALGLRRIKEVGGLTVVQDPSEAEYEAMPQAALATGDVEMVLPVAEIPARLVEYVHNRPQVSVPQDGEPLPEDVGEVVQKILTQVRAYTGQDFLRYKSATILRRIRRRMQIQGFATLSEYLKYLRDHTTEVQALYHDFLITVTSFFRDAEAFAYLEREIIPKIFQGKTGREGVRVWTVGCATGEEAYSVAILLLEHASGFDHPIDIQVFASDLSEDGLRQGREGFYPETIAADVAPERLERFFTKEQGGYRIRQAVRERVLFTPHSLLKDPPFSRIDLICCRNLLIYVQRDAQQEVMQLFHYALRGDPAGPGYLFLGTAETVESSELFREVSRKYSLYQRQPVASQQLRLPSLPLTLGRHRLALGPTLSDVRRPGPSYGEVHNQAIERYAPPSILVNADQNIVYFAEGVNRYLQQPAGEPTNQVLSRMRPELRAELMAALYRAQEKGTASHSVPIPLTLEGQPRQVGLVVQPLLDPELPGFVLIFFLESATDEPQQAAPLVNPQSDLVHNLESELAETKKRLQINLEEYETSQEEMRAVNEELQSMNEELRSAAEELETSKEELQSVNEELMTVNQENKNKIEELNQLTGDLQNLLASTEIATLFLDRELRIKRFTPRISDLFNVLVTDRGRPLAHITHKLGDADLINDAQRVLRKLAPIEREVQSHHGGWYIMRLLPYRTPDDRIDGVVITFVDISARKQAEEQLRLSEERQAFLLRLADRLRPLADPVAIQGEACRLLAEQLDVERAYYVEVDEERGIARVERDYVRNAAVSLVGEHKVSDFGWSVAILRRGECHVIPDTQSSPLVPPAERPPSAALGIIACMGAPLIKGGALVGALCVTDPQPRQWSESEVNLLRDVGERIWAAVERARAEEALAKSEEKYHTLFESIDEGVTTIGMIFDDDGRAVDGLYLDTNAASTKVTGRRSDIVGKKVSDLYENLEPVWLETFGRVAKTGEPIRFENFVAELDGGSWYDVYATRVGGDGSREVVLVYTNITGRKRTEANLAFLAEVSQDLVRLTNIDETIDTLGAKVGQHFQVARVNFAEIDEPADTAVIRHEWHRAGLSDIAGAKVYRLTDFISAEFYQMARAGEVIVVGDTVTDPRTDDRAYVQLTTRSFVTANFVRNGQWRFLLSIADTTPRDWRADEIELMRELANRIWTRLERARAEEALAQSHQELRQHADELERFNRVAVGRELRMIELKHQVNALAQRLAEEQPYPLAFEQGEADDQ